MRWWRWGPGRESKCAEGGGSRIRGTNSGSTRVSRARRTGGWRHFAAKWPRCGNGLLTANLVAADGGDRPRRSGGWDRQFLARMRG